MMRKGNPDMVTDRRRCKKKCDFDNPTLTCLSMGSVLL